MDRNLPPLKIAVIDDNPGVLDYLRTVFSFRGYDLAAYESVYKSPFLNHQNICPCPAHPACPDVMIVDIDMPGMNGLEFVSRMSARECRCRNVALMTGHSLSELDQGRLLKLNVMVFLKQYDINELLAWLEKVDRGRSGT